MKTIDTDYLVIGAGTAGLAFADTLIEEDKSAHVTIVDRRGKPGGHWNDAYPFVTLHQPSAFYGVNSTPLGSGRKDSVGLNKGLAELASGAEVCGYFDRVMNQRLIPSGRVNWRPMSNCTSDGGVPVVESLLSGRRVAVKVRRRLVDAAYFGPHIAATHTPRFAVAEGVRLVPPNVLPGLWTEATRGAALPRRFVVVGAGKTAMDAVSWLIGAGADPDAIQWITPRDSWLVNRITTQNGPEFFDEAIGTQADQMEALAHATSIEDLFLRLEACGMLLRLHPDRWPTMFHLATITPAEAAVLRQVHDVVRLGRVQRIEPGEIVLEQGRVPVPRPGETIFIDCTASAVAPRAIQPVFQPAKIVLQIVRLPQPAFSAALTAWLEVHIDGDDKAKNALAGSVPFPHTLADYPKAMAVGMWNQAQWGQHKALRQWIRESRLDGFSRLMASAAKDDVARQATIERLKSGAMAAMGNLPRLIAQAR